VRVPVRVPLAVAVAARPGLHLKRLGSGAVSVALTLALAVAGVTPVAVPIALPEGLAGARSGWGAPSPAGVRGKRAGERAEPGGAALGRPGGRRCRAHRPRRRLVGDRHLVECDAAARDARRHYGQHRELGPTERADARKQPTAARAA